MRSSLKVTVTLSFLVPVILGAVVSSTANPHIAAGAGASRVDSTRDLYAQNCARCHGLDGRGQTEQGRKYNVPDLVKEVKDASSSRITKIITNGRQDMPAFGKKLTKRQIAALTAYVRKL
jgi:mono/diheme cytochrome c family protein